MLKGAPPTGIKGLFLTGMDVAGLGVTGAMMGAIIGPFNQSH